ncbi:MAG: Asp-tRNA(Asn)/Glu-tRNA(Gln) amidotransferase subunit GatA [Polyangiales bacterium]
MSDAVHTLGVRELRNLVGEGGASVRSVVEAHLARIETHDVKVRSFVHVDRASALEAADAMDARRKRGESLGALAGSVIALKDNLCTVGSPTTCASRILRGYVSPFDAHVIERLRAADAVLVGKTNMDEFAMGSSTENSSLFPTHNPWDLERTPGGSSGGSAAATASAFVTGALGSDTGGSVRQPGALCGVAALKPTYGRVSRYGLIAFASSLDQVGTFGRSVGDAASIFGAIAGHDPRDATSVDRPAPVLDDIGAGLPTGTRIGVVRSMLAEGLAEDVRESVTAAIARLKDAGAEIVDVELPHAHHAIAVYYLVATAEASSNLARFDGVRYGHRAEAKDLFEMYTRTRAEGFGDEVKRRIMLGTYALAAGYYDAYYLRAQKVRTLIRRDFERAFEACDAIVTPTTPTTAFRIGEKSSDPLAMYLADVFTVPPTWPACSNQRACGAGAGGLPVGLQLLGPPHSARRSCFDGGGGRARCACPDSARVQLAGEREPTAVDRRVRCGSSRFARAIERRIGLPEKCVADLFAVEGGEAAAERHIPDIPGMRSASIMARRRSAAMPAPAISRPAGLRGTLHSQRPTTSVVRALAVSEHIRDALEDGVARGMPKAVVDGLEAVHVGEHHRQWRAVPS